MTSGGNPLSGPAPVNDDPALTLQQLDEVRQRTRATVHPAWFPLLVFGSLGLASIPLGFVGDGAGTGLFWLVAGPAGGYATSRYYRNRAVSLGAGVRGRAYKVLGFAIFVAAWVSGVVTGSAAGPMLAVAVGYLAFARLERSRPVAAVSVVLGVAAVVVAVTDPSHGDVVLDVIFGLAFTGTGLLLRRRDPVV
jgi:hypothetical protein